MKTHDYTRRYWGHDFTIWEKSPDAHRFVMSGWGRGISNGDYMILSDGEGGTTRYQFAEVKYHLDPGDMWKAVLHFAPRTAEEKG